jgi:hypothetical protein
MGRHRTRKLLAGGNFVFLAQILRELSACLPLVCRPLYVQKIIVQES